MPAGWPTLVLRIFAADAEGLVRFVKDVFAAEGTYHAERPTEIRIGDSLLMVAEAGEREAMAGFLYVYVPDADATFRRATDRGARSLETPRDMPYGDRRAMVEDAWGNTWQIATHGGRFTP